MSFCRPGPSTFLYGQQQAGENFDYFTFCATKLDRAIPIKYNELLDPGRQSIVTGHSGPNANTPVLSLKPMNPRCLRSRRENLFFQLVKYFQFGEETNLKYRDFPIFMHPEKAVCNCLIDPETFRSIQRFVPFFANTRHLIADGFEIPKAQRAALLAQLYDSRAWCACYSDDPRAKAMCSVDYSRLDFMSIEHITAHCSEPCTLTVKMGRIPYDPMASDNKKAKELAKYERLRDFGFRITSYANDFQFKGKAEGKQLHTQEQIFVALEDFFEPLGSAHQKVVVVGRMLDLLERILEWFETKNNNQLRFYNSSLMFCFDIAAADLEVPYDVKVRQLRDSVRVKLIHFRHVFHSHDPQEGPSRSGSKTSICTSGDLNKDDSYLYGLRRLVKFFIMIVRQARARQRAIEDMEYAFPPPTIPEEPEL